MRAAATKKTKLVSPLYVPVAADIDFGHTQQTIQRSATVSLGLHAPARLIVTSAVHLSSPRHVCAPSLVATTIMGKSKDLRQRKRRKMTDEEREARKKKNDLEKEAARPLRQAADKKAKRSFFSTRFKAGAPDDALSSSDDENGDVSAEESDEGNSAKRDASEAAPTPNTGKNASVAGDAGNEVEVLPVAAGAVAVGIGPDGNKNGDASAEESDEDNDSKKSTPEAVPRPNTGKSSSNARSASNEVYISPVAAGVGGVDRDAKTQLEGAEGAGIATMAGRSAAATPDAPQAPPIANHTVAAANEEVVEPDDQQPRWRNDPALIRDPGEEGVRIAEDRGAKTQLEGAEGAGIATVAGRLAAETPGVLEDPPMVHRPVAVADEAVAEPDDQQPRWRNDPALIHDPGEEGVCIAEDSTGDIKRYTGILKDAYNSKPTYEDAARNVRRGKLWKRQADYVSKSAVPPGQVAKCWKLFYQYDRFDWLPNEMEPGWLPKCILCDAKKDKVSIHTRSHPPRLVYGLTKNYLLNSPIQYRCSACYKKNREEMSRGVPKKERAQYTFLNTDRAVLKLLQSEHPDVYSLFPCHLTWKSAIDNKIIELLKHCNENSMGPVCVANYVKCLHREHKDERELQWLRFCLKRIDQPVLNEVIGRGSIEMFPDYDSEELCGVTPSQAYLTEAFCKVTMDLKEEHDSHQKRRLETSIVGTIDASYKVPKWVAAWKGSKMYDAMMTGKNEYAETLISHFAISDNHRELRFVLEQLKKEGFHPEWFFTDVVPRDTDMLEDVYHESLTIDVERDSRLLCEPSLPSDLEVLPLRAEYVYGDTSEKAVAALIMFMEAVEKGPSKEVFIDFEWAVHPDNTTSGKMGTFQFASHDQLEDLLLQPSIMTNPSTLLRTIKTFLVREDLVFIGNCVANDITKLKQFHPEFNFRVPNVIDVGAMAVRRGVVKRGPNQTTLDNLVEVVTGYSLQDQSGMCKRWSKANQNSTKMACLSTVAFEEQAALRLRTRPIPGHLGTFELGPSTLYVLL